jgi:hypothetical protein
MQSKPFLLILVSHNHGDPNHLVHGSVPISSCQRSACPSTNLAILLRPQFLLRSAIGGLHFWGHGHPICRVFTSPAAGSVLDLPMLYGQRFLTPAKHRACLHPLSSWIVLVGTTVSKLQLEESVVM